MPEFRKPDAGETALFSVRPDDQFGGLDAGAWFGLLWHQGRPGGVILCAEGAGREIAVINSDSGLQAAWRHMTGDPPAAPARYRNFPAHVRP